MALAPKITVTKKFNYRGNPELWSNSYHLDTAPPDTAHWVTLAQAIAVLEQPLYTSETVVDSFLGYDDSSPHVPAIWSANAADISADFFGTLVIAGTDQAWAGDQAGTVGWKTGLLGSTGKPIWLRKYFHDGGSYINPNEDYISANVTAAYNTFATDLLTAAISATAGPGDGPVYFADKNARRPDGPTRLDLFVTTRTLERRGKRP